GNPRDVEKVMEVIRQIEEMSRVSEPQVVVYPLTNVNSQAMAALLRQLFAPPAAADQTGFSLTSYYGRLLSLPLGRPNAVLLVGGPTAVGKATELLKQLDIPGQTTQQFEVFRLKNTRASQAQEIVEKLFTAPQNDQTAPATFAPKA